MEIRKFHHDHRVSLRQLYLESRTATFTWLDTRQFKLSDFERDTDGEQIWVAVEGEDVIGFISIWEPECFIHHLFVRPQKLRTGVGLKLLTIGKQYYSELSLKCLVANENAVGFYHSVGFTIVSTTENGLESYHLMKLSTQA
ncbi:GNAT family N-acetyltransferase [Vibrio sp. S11_S32]|uniref:GNAT family N-acetyltransferase n=1 Tax=Vibrio sp. S11_S32 TaxID=2720225 RepID=UPI001680E2D0|nr:GNAT family N-acetyltransferase [Vibrio sp. S11_S32]MBD1577026.1 GNAT family N-acetyltransferase [Vibrio sp. S11_S32]